MLGMAFASDATQCLFQRWGIKEVRAERIEDVVQDSFEPRSCLHQNSLLVCR